MQTLYYSTWQSPVGPLTLVASERGLVALEFGNNLERLARVSDPGTHRVPRPSPVLARAGVSAVYSDEKLAPYRRQLEQYFAGERREFTIPLDLRGTDFQLACWRELLKIPYGETRSYAEIARAVGQPKAFRAVGTANHDNPVAIIVPCHRVIGSNGKLTGYGGGLELKQRLLDLERGQLVFTERTGDLVRALPPGRG
jgi:O-6-methylguanine DNA methyltransferase